MSRTIRDASEFFSHHEKRIQPISESGCWIWTGATNGVGYGDVRVPDGRALAHRLAFEAVNGPIPDGVMIRHRCDIPSCVNPAHLLPGSQVDNMADMRARERQSRGERRPTSKLTAGLVREIRRRATSGATIYRIAKDQKLSWHTVWKVVKRTSWRHIQ